MDKHSEICDPRCVLSVIYDSVRSSMFDLLTKLIVFCAKNSDCHLNTSEKISRGLSTTQYNFIMSKVIISIVLNLFAKLSLQCKVLQFYPWLYSSIITWDSQIVRIMYG